MKLSHNNAASRLFDQKTCKRRPSQSTVCGVNANSSRSPHATATNGRAFDKVRNAAHAAGYSLQNNSFGPIVSVSLKSDGSIEERAKISGGLLPNGRMHIESYRALSRGVSSALLSVTPAIFVFIGALAHASDRNCHTVTGLAINDDSIQHRRLLTYLRRYGGHVKYIVDDSLAKLPARILYGGFGTVVEGDVSEMLSRALGMLERQVLNDKEN